jgi:hypothetical protein
MRMSCPGGRTIRNSQSKRPLPNPLGLYPPSGTFPTRERIRNILFFGEGKRIFFIGLEKDLNFLVLERE